MEEQKIYVEEKLVKSVTPLEEKTPLDDAIFEVEFEDGSKTTMTNLKFQTIQTTEKSDATAARNELSKAMASRIYSMLMEYGLKFSEVDPVLNEVVRLINDGQNAALDVLWGNEAYDRNLLDVNRVLKTKYASETETSEGADAPTPEGSSADSENA